jgi:hypothetical protein
LDRLCGQASSHRELRHNGLCYPIHRGATPSFEQLAGAVNVGFKEKVRRVRRVPADVSLVA